MSEAKQRTTRYAGGKQKVIPKKSPIRYNKGVQAYCTKKGDLGIILQYFDHLRERIRKGAEQAPLGKPPAYIAAEFIMERADAEQPHMGLTSWEHYPNGKIQSTMCLLRRIYLSQNELQALERIVSMYLDYGNIRLDVIFRWPWRIGRYASTAFWSLTSMRFCRIAVGRMTREIAKS